MHDVVLGKKLKCSCDIEDYFSDLILVVFKSSVKIAIMNTVHLLIVILLAF